MRIECRYGHDRAAATPLRDRCLELGSTVSILDTAPDLTDIDPETDRFPEVVTITDTTELRWFAEGQLPAAIDAWFTHDHSAGFVEERCDTYLLDDRFDTGVKRRFGHKLELKVRRSIGERIDLGPGLAGRLEVWRRWSPAECLIVPSLSAPWADVCKTVVKRRFSVDGSEIMISADDRAMTGAGCDVEIAAVTVNDITAWTFAFAAFGPVDGRSSALVASIDALVADGVPPEHFGPFFGLSSGYPEWLALVTSRRDAISACDLRRR